MAALIYMIFASFAVLLLAPPLLLVALAFDERSAPARQPSLTPLPQWAENVRPGAQSNAASERRHAA